MARPLLPFVSTCRKPKWSRKKSRVAATSGTCRSLALDYHVKTRGEDFVLSLSGANNVANTLAFLGRADEAIALQRKVVEIERRTTGPDQPDMLWFENNLANFYDRAGHLAEAESTYRDIVCRGRGQFTKGEWDFGHFLFNLGAVLAKDGKTAEARAALVESVGILTATLGSEHKRTQRAKAALDALTTPPAAKPHSQRHSTLSSQSNAR